MKTFKVVLFAFLSINIAIWLITYFLNINLFSVLRIESPNIEIAEPSYKLSSNVVNSNDPYNAPFILYDSECNRFGPFSFEEALIELTKGLTTTCSLTIPDENAVLINLHERRDGSNTGIKNDVTNFLYSLIQAPDINIAEPSYKLNSNTVLEDVSYPGFEGDEDSNLRIQLAIYQLPDPLRTILTTEVDVLNGCHPYGEALFNRCVYGVFDPVGYGADGNYGNNWAMTVWISDRGIQSGKLKDILIHEAAHAYSYLVLRGCILQGGTTFRELAHQRYGDDENLADVFVYYYGGKWTNYYKLDYLPEQDRKWVADMIDYCEVYQEAVSALTISS